MICQRVNLLKKDILFIRLKISCAAACKLKNIGSKVTSRKMQEGKTLQKNI